MFRRPTCALLILLLCATVSGGEDTRAAVSEFRKRFVPGMSAYTREKALDELAAVKDRKVRKTFQWAFGQTSGEIRHLVLEKDDARAELKRLEKSLDDKLMRESERARRKGRKPGPVSVPNTLQIQIRNTREKVERLQRRIDAEHKIREALTQAGGAWIDGFSEKDRSVVLTSLEEKGLEDKDWTVRAFWIRTLGGTSHPAATRLLMGLANTEKDRRILPVVIDALAAQAGDLAIDDLLALSNDERWQIRATVIAALGRIGSPAAIQPLIDWLRKEEGRLRGDLSAALKELTGQDLGIYPDRWQEWWDLNRTGFVPPRDWKEPEPEPEPAEDGEPGAEPPPDDPGKEPPQEAPPEPEPASPPPPAGEDRPSFYGIDILSKRIIFVIDISNSMNQPVKADDANRTKVDVAKYELKNAILGLPDDAAFNIIFYHHEVSQWQKGMVTAKGKDRRAAVKFVENMIADGNTNIHDALKLAFHIVGMGARDKNYELGADTIFFLSDGIPNRGEITDPVQILEEVKRWNQLRRVKVHTVGVGADHAAAFMQSLAANSGGTYVSR